MRLAIPAESKRSKKRDPKRINKTLRITKGEVSREDALLVQKYAKQCMRHLMKKEYELDIPKGAQHSVPIEVFNGNGRGRSTGGNTGISININSGHFIYDVFREYAAFNADPVIGKIPCVTWKDMLFVIVAHEISHYVQYRFLRRLERYKGKWQKPHGYGFQSVYRYLRRDLVNPLITRA